MHAIYQLHSGRFWQVPKHRIGLVSYELHDKLLNRSSISHPTTLAWKNLWFYNEPTLLPLVDSHDDRHFLKNLGMHNTYFVNIFLITIINIFTWQYSNRLWMNNISIGSPKEMGITKGPIKCFLVSKSLGNKLKKILAFYCGKRFDKACQQCRCHSRVHQSEPINSQWTQGYQSSLLLLTSKIQKLCDILQKIGQNKRHNLK